MHGGVVEETHGVLGWRSGFVKVSVCQRGTAVFLLLYNVRCVSHFVEKVSAGKDISFLIPLGDLSLLIFTVLCC